MQERKICDMTTELPYMPAATNQSVVIGPRYKKTWLPNRQFKKLPGQKTSHMLHLPRRQCMYLDQQASTIVKSLI